MSLLQSVFSRIKEPTSDKNRSEELIGDRRSMGYHLADNIFGFDDGYETKGEKAGTAVKEAITNPVETGKAIATGMYDAIDKGMDGQMAFYEGPDYQVDIMGNPVGTDEEVAKVNQALGQADQDYLMNNLEITAGVGAGGMSASKALMNVDPDAAYSGLFLNARTIAKADPDLQKAYKLEAQGVGRDEIWEQTGWGKLFDEWVKETDDSLTYTKKMADSGVAAKNLGVPDASTPKTPEGLPKETSAVSAKKRKQAERDVESVQRKYRELLRIFQERVRKGEMDQDALVTYSEQLKDQMAIEVNQIRNREMPSPTPAPQPDPTVADPIDRNLKNDGLLSEVLGNRPKDLEDALNSPYRERSQFGGVARQAARAESGVRQHGSYYGVYGQDQGKIKSFKRFGIGGANNPQDKKDILNLDMNQTAATAEWSTLLHETQHYLDDVFRSTSGRGSNTKGARDRKAVRAWARDKYNDEKKDIDRKFKKGSDEHTAAVEVLDNTRHGKARKSSTKGGYDDFAFYTRDAGETKARLVQARRSMSAAERRAEPPWKTMEKLFGDNGNYPTTEDEVFRLSEYGDYYDNSYMRPPKEMGDVDGNAMDILGLTEADRKAWEALPENQGFKQQQMPEVKSMAEKLRDNEITSKEFRDFVNEIFPPRMFTAEDFPQFSRLEDIALALDKGQLDRAGVVGVNKSFKQGERKAVRLDIPAYTRSNTWVVSVHDGVKGGKAEGYAQTAHLKAGESGIITFDTSPKTALDIAAETTRTNKKTGEVRKTAKSTFARIFGEWNEHTPEDLYARARQILESNDPEWIQVGMNPYRASYFYDKVDNMPITEAQEVIQIGPLVLVKGAKKVSPDDPMFKINKDPNDSRTMSAGGLITKSLNSQMNAIF